ncbi:MAG: DUF4258 domain-containing protein [Acidobacteriota bacterium]
MFPKDKLLADEAKRLILLIIEEGRVGFSAHCLRESMPKRNATVLDVEHALRTGEIIRDPEWDEKHQQWKYRVEGVDTEGDDLTAITIIIESNLHLFIVTVF